ncbi:hypothetical protein [Microbacterium maritypicum]
MIPDSPDDRAIVLRAFGIPALRAGIIRVTLTRGSVTAQDLMDDLQVGRTTLIAHTQALVDAGILVQESDPSKLGARSGFNRLVWRVDEQALRGQLDALTSFLGLTR